MKDPLFEGLELTPVLNAVGYATPLGNGRLDEAVINGMASAAGRFMLISEIQSIASEQIAAITHAEAGYVVSGAAAGLALATAACLTGLDPVKMNLLPRIAKGGPSTVVVHRAHRYDYDHAVRQVGARLREVGFVDFTFPYELEAAVRADTAAVLYRADGLQTVLSLPQVIEIAHERDVPVIVDAALAVPPVENLHAFTDMGADLVVFSGGKAIGGPPATGFVAGRADLISSIALQHQDMDLRLETWSGNIQGLSGVRTPPYQGVGRAMKVGKEQIVGLLIALDRYTARDHDRDLIDWLATLDRISRELSSQLPGLELDLDRSSHVPQLRLRFPSRSHAEEVSRRLHERTPAVFCNEGLLWNGCLIIVPTCLRPDEEQQLVGALVEVVPTVIA